MEAQARPIGVFDSGLGGISVLRACVRLLPQENFLFFGDSANAPYGEKSLDQVRALTLSAVDRLLAQGVKGIVVACNTATSAAIGLLRQLHPGLPIIGIEPAVKPAALAAGSSSVIVMATPLTIREDKYQKLAAAFCGHANVISLPCKGLAEMVERGIFDGPVLDAYLQDLLLPFRYCNIDYIVLGCTHYPFVRKAIARNFGRPVSTSTGSEGTARQLRRAGGRVSSDRPNRVRHGHLSKQPPGQAGHEPDPVPDEILIFQASQTRLAFSPPFLSRRCPGSAFVS